MLKAIAEIAFQKKIDYQVSMEERMACGVGACKGCPVKTKSGYKMVCKDGPVFRAEEIVWS
jgi:dihydroorotate dehydrogenase electron transfer subunit